MIGRRIAGLCAMLAAVLGILAASSHLTAVSFTLWNSDQDAVIAHFFDGRSRLFWFHSPQIPIETEADLWAGAIHVRSQQRRIPPLPETEAGPPSPPSFSVPIRIAYRGQVPSLGGRWRRLVANRPAPPAVPWWPVWSFESSFVRVPTWPMVILLMIPPIRRSIVVRRRRRRAARNECLECGYNLTALVEPRCPECGTRIGDPHWAMA